MSTKAKKITQRVISAFMAALLCSMLWMDGHVKAAIIAQENPGLSTAVGAVAAAASPASEPAAPSQPDTGSDIQEQVDKAYAALDSLKATTDDSDRMTYYRNNGIDLVKEVLSTVITNEVNGAIGDFCLVAGNKLYTSGGSLLARAGALSTSAGNMQQEINALAARVGQAGSKGTQRRLANLMEKQAGKAGDAVSMTRWGQVYKIGGKIISGVSIGLDAYGIYSDYQGLHDLKNEHASLRAVEGGLYVADMGLAAASIICAGAILAGATVAAPVTAAIAIGGLVVGIASAIVSSDGFANLMNNTDNATLQYFDNLVSNIFQNIKTALGIGCYKPNIYIYGADGQTVRVIMQTPGLIVKSIPEYDRISGWQVQAQNDGLLTDAAGDSYDFLFYESMTERTLFDREDGFYISAQNRTAQWEEILSAYGFSGQEISDFIEFWDAKLEKEDYIMYPQYTETVDEAMPVEIIPAPEHLIRMWFGFELYDGQQYQEAEILPFDRTGYTVVEWGGMIF